MAAKTPGRFLSFLVALTMLFTNLAAYAKGEDLVIFFDDKSAYDATDSIFESTGTQAPAPTATTAPVTDAVNDPAAVIDEPTAPPDDVPPDVTEEIPPVDKPDYNTGAAWSYPVSPSELMTDYVRLANASSLLEADYVPSDLVTLKVQKTTNSAIKMRQVAADALTNMFSAASDVGLTLYAKSGYRSYKQQKTMYANRLAQNGGKDDGYVTKPGASDHQTGLGIDVVNKEWRDRKLNSGFAETKEAQWMANNCHLFGFIIRYPNGKESVTEIAFEPWHLRYVGITAAAYIMDSDMTLEDFSVEWPPILEAFLQAGGDPNTVYIEGLEYVPFGSKFYKTSILGKDGDFEYSLFDLDNMSEKDLESVAAFFETANNSLNPVEVDEDEDEEDDFSAYDDIDD